MRAPLFWASVVCVVTHADTLLTVPPTFRPVLQVQNIARQYGARAHGVGSDPSLVRWFVAGADRPPTEVLGAIGAVRATQDGLFLRDAPPVPRGDGNDVARTVRALWNAIKTRWLCQWMRLTSRWRAVAIGVLVAGCVGGVLLYRQARIGGGIDGPGSPHVRNSSVVRALGVERD